MPGKSMNLNNLTPEEAQQILQVIQKDFELRQKEKERLCKIEEDISEEDQKTTILNKQQKFNENCCIRCCESFGIFFNRKQLCQTCRMNVCKGCSQYDDKVKGYVCKACLKEGEYKSKSFQWFYNNVSQKFKRFGSAKVVRTLYKLSDTDHKYHSDNESDSGYDPSLYSSFDKSGSLRVKRRPSLKAIFPDLVIKDEDVQELDNGIFPAPPITPNANTYITAQTSLTTLHSTPNATSPIPSPRGEVLDNKEQEKRDIYREAFESTKRTEEAKFKVRFDNLLSDIQHSFEKLSPRDGTMPSGYGSTSYGELMTTYKSRIKDLMVSLSQRLELAVESFDDSYAHSASATGQKVRQMISKLVEDRLGETLDLTSDEAVSDLSSLSDESGEKSFEDQIAQAVIARMLELHRHPPVADVHLDLREPVEPMIDSSGSEERINDTSSSVSKDKTVTDSDGTSDGTETSEKNNNEVNLEVDKHTNVTQTKQQTNVGHDVDVDITDGAINVGESVNETEIHTNGENGKTGQISESDLLRNEFDKLRTFAMEVTPRPLYEETQMQEEIEAEPIEESMEKVAVDHEESQQEFETRFFTFDKIHDTDNRAMPDFSDLEYEYHDFGINEVDPDLLSMNLAAITEETEEELEDDENDETTYEQDWRGNWLFKGATEVSPYANIARNKVAGEFGDLYMLVPQPNDESTPQIGNKYVDDMSDLSDQSDLDSLDRLSDEENSFYAKTSEEIARITRKSSNSTQASAMANTSVQTEDDSESESMASRQFSSSFSDSGIRSNRHEQNSFDSRTSDTPKPKLSEESIPAEGNDPKFEIPPDSVVIPEGEPAKFTCRVGGTQPLDVFWYHVHDEVEELQNSENYEIVKDGNRHHLTCYNQSRDSDGQYMCIAMNEKGRCCQYFILNMKKNTQELKPPEFLKGISDNEVSEGQTVKFRCKVKGYPQSRVVWYKDGQLLGNSVNCRIERFGNRDYLLAIESATMDEDAEYSVLAKNIAGEARSSAQLIVEPKHKPESVPKPIPSKPKDEPKKEAPGSPVLVIPNYFSSSRKPTPSPQKPAVKSKRKDEQNLSNLSQKVSLVKENVTNVAEDMLSSTKELTEIDQSIAAMDKILADLESDIISVSSDDLTNNNEVISSLAEVSEIEVLDNYWVMKEAAENVRKTTSKAMDYLNSAEPVILREKHDMEKDVLATSTPRSSTIEINRNKQNLRIDTDYDLAAESHDTSTDSHKSEISFTVSPIPKTPVDKVDSGVNNKSADLLSSRTGAIHSAKDVGVVSSQKPIIESRTRLYKEPVTSAQSESRVRLSSGASPKSSESNDDVFYDRDLPSSPGSETVVVNAGPKRESKERYDRDYYIVNTPRPARKTSSESSDSLKSPRDHKSPREDLKSPRIDLPSPREEKQRAHTEEKIYLTAGNVYNLENRVQSLHDKLHAVNLLVEQDKLAKLEGNVATTFAKVEQSEKQVKSIERTVHQLNDPKPRMSNKSRRAPSPPPPRPITPPREVERPEPTFLKGHTIETELPESRTEVNEDYGSVELPSVLRLKAMFGGKNKVSPMDKDASIKRPPDMSENNPLDPDVHSITARSVPKQQLALLRDSNTNNNVTQTKISDSMATPDGPKSPGRATALTTGQQIKQTPAMPKPVFQSTNFTTSITTTSHVKTPKSHQQNTHNQSNVRQKPVSKSQPMRINLSTNKTNRPISPFQTQAMPLSQTQPIRTHIVGKSSAPKPPSQSNVPLQQTMTGSEIDTPEGRRSPKIKSGSISAMSRFWEKRGTGERADDSIPDIVTQYDD